MIGRTIKKICAVLAFMVVVCLILVSIMAPLMYARGAIYQVNFGNISPEKCSILVAGDKDVEYIDTVWDTDPCTQENILYFLYAIEWKTDAREWFTNWLSENDITALSIGSGNTLSD